MENKKVQQLENMQKIVKELKQQGKKVIFTNGCFDLLHVGHVRYLKEAKSHGDVMIVGINSDDSVRKIKGEKRPIVPAVERLEILAELECIDYLVVFSQTTPEDVIKKIAPDVLVKGSDYEVHEVVGRDFVEAAGGKVILVPLVRDRSTTRLIKKIKEGV
ncbi:MAG: D-glycero-beta-D-manno-heptose 1-phosphate adenylyltransferase [bacterium]